MPDDISEAERRRRLLQTKLEEFTKHPVYFQPPSTPGVKPALHLTFPCTMYTLSDIYVRHANNMAYTAQRRYQITYITKNPADELIDEFVNQFEQITFSRHFTSDNLNHYIYELYY